MSNLTWDEYDYVEETIGSLMTASVAVKDCEEVTGVCDGFRLAIGSLVTLGSGVDALAASTLIEGLDRGHAREIVNAIRGVIERGRNAKILEPVKAAADRIPDFDPTCN